MIPSPCNITIAIICGGTVRAETLVSLIGAMEVIKGHGIGASLSVQIGGYAAANRNRAVEAAQRNGSDYLMFIDNDMIFPNSGIQRLLDADKDIIGVHYNARPAPDKPVVSTVKMSDPNGQLLNAMEIPAQLFKCYAVGTGFMLIRMSIFDKLSKPYFVSGEDASGECFTEDVDFCRKAGEAGVKIYCNPTIAMRHIGNKEY